MGNKKRTNLKLKLSSRVYSFVVYHVQIKKSNHLFVLFIPEIAANKNYCWHALKFAFTEKIPTYVDLVVTTPLTSYQNIDTNG